MNHDEILEVGIDDKERLYVMPKTHTFRYIYREAMEVHWDEGGRYLYAPQPPRAQLASPAWWFGRILEAAREQSCQLNLGPNTKWQNIPDNVKAEIISTLGGPHA